MSGTVIIGRSTRGALVTLIWALGGYSRIDDHDPMAQWYRYCVESVITLGYYTLGSAPEVSKVILVNPKSRVSDISYTLLYIYTLWAPLG